MFAIAVFEYWHVAAPGLSFDRLWPLICLRMHLWNGGLQSVLYDSIPAESRNSIPPLERSRRIENLCGSPSEVSGLFGGAHSISFTD